MPDREELAARQLHLREELTALDARLNRGEAEAAQEAEASTHHVVPPPEVSALDARLLDAQVNYDFSIARFQQCFADGEAASRRAIAREIQMDGSSPWLLGPPAPPLPVVAPAPPHANLLPREEAIREERTRVQEAARAMIAGGRGVGVVPAPNPAPAG